MLHDVAWLSAIMPHLFPLVGSIFSFIFLVIIMLVLVRALKKNDISGLYSDDQDPTRISTTKFWQNVAYAAATVAFLGVNLAATSTTGLPLEIVWMIYLGVVASNAVMSKWIGAKYSYHQTENDQPRYPTRYPRYPRLDDRYDRYDRYERKEFSASDNEKRVDETTLKPDDPDA